MFRHKPRVNTGHLSHHFHRSRALAERLSHSAPLRILREHSRSWGAPTLVAAASLGLMLPLFKVYWFHSHEWVGYLARTSQFNAGLRAGELYPRWCPDFYGGYGSPFFVFYAPLVYFLGAVFMFATRNTALALQIVAALGSLLAGLGTYKLIVQETRRADAALVAAFAFLMTPYRITDLTVRGDLAEFMALSLLPCVVYGYRSLLHEEDPRKLVWRAFSTALMHAALVMAHTLLGLWGTGVVAVVAGISAVQLWRRKATTRLVLVPTVFVGALALACVYWLPAFTERSLVRVEAMAEGYYSPDHQWLHLTTLLKPGQFQILPLLAATLALALIALLRRRNLGFEWLWLAGATLLVSLTLPNASWIWEAHLIPFGRMIQFPWRLLGPAALCGAVALGFAWHRALPQRYPVALAAFALAIGTYTNVGRVHHGVNPMPPSDSLERTTEIRKSMTSTTGVDEYLPLAVKARPQNPAQTLVAKNEHLSKLHVDSDHTSHTMEFTATEATSMDLALHHYPGWSVEVLSGPTSTTLQASDEGHIRLWIPSAGKYRLKVSFEDTPFRVISAFISLATLLAFFVALTSRSMLWRH